MGVEHASYYTTFNIPTERRDWNTLATTLPLIYQLKDDSTFLKKVFRLTGRHTLVEQQLFLFQKLEFV